MNLQEKNYGMSHRMLYCGGILSFMEVIYVEHGVPKGSYNKPIETPCVIVIVQIQSQGNDVCMDP